MEREGQKSEQCKSYITYLILNPKLWEYPFHCCYFRISEEKCDSALIILNSYNLLLKISS